MRVDVQMSEAEQVATLVEELAVRRGGVLMGVYFKVFTSANCFTVMHLRNQQGWKVSLDGFTRSGADLEETVERVWRLAEADQPLDLMVA